MLKRIGLLIVATGLAGAAFAAEPPKSSDWKMSGDLEEACSCDAACPCWMESKPTRMNCAGGQVIFIDKGSYGGVPLDGLAIGMVGQNPDHTTMMDSIGNWQFAYVYLDAKATPEQRKALEAIAAQTIPPLAPPGRTKTFWVPITRAVNGNNHTIRVGNDWTFTGHLVEGGLGGPTKIVNPPGADPIHHEYMQGRTSATHYAKDDRDWNWSNTNYMYGNFDVDGEQYAKFNQMMMQMMMKAKDEKK